MTFQNNILIRNFKIAAALLLASIGNTATPSKLQPPVITPQADKPAQQTLDQLKKNLLRQIQKNRLTLPGKMIGDGKEPGFFGWLERASLATNNLILGIGGMHEPSAGATDSNGIVGISRDDEVGQSVKKGIYAKNCHNYFDTHFSSFQLMVLMHETSHYVDRQLGLSSKIEAYTLQAADNFKINPEIITPRDGGISLLRRNIGERIADASAALYLLSNYGDRDTAQAIAYWRDAGMEETHYSSSTTFAAINMFKEHPQRNMDIVATTKAAADIVSRNMGHVIVEQQALEFAQMKSGIMKANTMQDLSPKASRARNALCGISSPLPS